VSSEQFTVTVPAAVAPAACVYVPKFRVALPMVQLLATTAWTVRVPVLDAASAAGVQRVIRPRVRGAGGGWGT